MTSHHGELFLWKSILENALNPESLSIAPVPPQRLVLIFYPNLYDKRHEERKIAHTQTTFHVGSWASICRWAYKVSSPIAPSFEYHNLFSMSQNPRISPPHIHLTRTSGNLVRYPQALWGSQSRLTRDVQASARDSPPTELNTVLETPTTNPGALSTASHTPTAISQALPSLL